MAEKLDVLVLVPAEPATGAMTDPTIRRTQIARLWGPMNQALCELEAHVGRPLRISHPDSALRFGDEQWPVTPGRRAGQDARRSLSAVTLATHLERAGLRWAVLDPSARQLSYWRERLMEYREREPATVAVCSTFVTHEPWIRTLCALVRRTLPRARLLLGGYYYSVNIKKFLSLDADVFCTGEGEERLPKIVAALRDGRSLDDIPGLYLRRPDGSLHSTGRAEPLNLEELPFVDFGLSERIDPPIPLSELSSTAVETQRGCVFKCEFCDYRTIALPNVMTAERAVEAILAAAAGSTGGVRITDATASFPHGRWDRILDLLIARGGSPVPLWCYTRVSDLADATAERMGKAGVRHVFVGQESGDQRILLAMKKGTSVADVKPAVAALARYGIGATFSFIHGFPGEDAASIAATRSMIVHMNDGFEDRPPVLHYLVTPLLLVELASISRSEDLKGIDHMMGYDRAGAITIEQALTACYDTFIEASRVPHAPALMVAPGEASYDWEDALFFSPHRHEIFRWYKTIERGVAIFMQRAVEGTPPDGAELARIKRRIEGFYPALPAWRSLAVKAEARARAAIAGRLQRELLREKAEGPGLWSRALVGLSALRDTRDLDFARSSFEKGEYADMRRPDAGSPPGPSPANLDVLADELLEDSFGEAQRKRQIESAKKIVSPDKLRRAARSSGVATG